MKKEIAEKTELANTVKKAGEKKAAKEIMKGVKRTKKEIKRLKKRQEELKNELFSAKARINSDPQRWSYELHTEESGMEPTDPNFVEAFERETAILDKRVQACRSHVVVSTAFVGQAKDEERGAYRGCTADCEWAGEAEKAPQL